MYVTSVTCFVCSKPGHKSFDCPDKHLNKKNNLAKAETSATRFRSRSRSPIERHSNDDEESTHSAGDTSLTEKDFDMKLNSRTNVWVYIGYFPKEWKPLKIKHFIMENFDQIRGRAIFFDVLKDKKFNASGVIRIRIDKETANIIAENLANKMCDGKKLMATLDPYAPFLKNILATGHSVRRARDELKCKKYNRNRMHDSQRDNEFEINTIMDDSDDHNLYGLSRNFLNALDITPPLRNSIFVANFDCEKVNQEKLREIFSLAGQVLIVYIFRNSDGTPKKCAKVTFDHPVEAVQAISMFHNQTLYDQHLVIHMDNSPKNFMSALPEGIKKIGPGLGPEGKPLRNVRTTIEWKPLKHILLKELSNSKANSENSLEKSIPHNSFFHQNVPIGPNYARGGAEPMEVNPMALNSVINQIAQNAAMNIMSQTPGINPMAQNAAMNPMAQNAAMNPMAQNAAMNPMAQNLNPMAQNAAMNPMAQNLNPMAQNATMNPMAQNAAMNPMAQNLNPMAQNAAMNPMAQNLNPMAQNAAMNPMAQNAAMNPMAQNSEMNPMAQNVAINAMAPNAAMNVMAQNVDPNLMARNNLNLMAQNHHTMGMNSINNQISDMQQPNMMANMQGYQQQVVINAQSRAEWNLATGYVGNSSGASQTIDNRVNQSNTAQREYNPSDVTESRGDGDSDIKDTRDTRSHMLLFTNLPYSVTQESLSSKMREIGKLKFIELTGQGRAIMSFEKYTDAERCINLFHRCKVDGQIIEVKFF